MKSLYKSKFVENTSIDEAIDILGSILKDRPLKLSDCKKWDKSYQSMAKRVEKEYKYRVKNSKSLDYFSASKDNIHILYFKGYFDVEPTAALFYVIFRDRFEKILNAKEMNVCVCEIESTGDTFNMLYLVC